MFGQARGRCEAGVWGLVCVPDGSKFAEEVEEFFAE